MVFTEGLPATEFVDHRPDMHSCSSIREIEQAPTTFTQLKLFRLVDIDTSKSKKEWKMARGEEHQLSDVGIGAEMRK